MAEAMQRAHYPLQALLYTVALHRYLRWRLRGYDPDRNLAGVLYLFLRGMAGADTPRLGHVHVDLRAVRHTATVDVDVPVDLQALPWPEPEAWVAAVAASPLVAAGEDGPDDRPLRLIGSWLYLDRHWREERQVAADLAVRAEHTVGGVHLALV